jgi:hypothetical protein
MIAQFGVDDGDKFSHDGGKSEHGILRLRLRMTTPGYARQPALKSSHAGLFSKKTLSF